jgi:hypothetical protein
MIANSPHEAAIWTVKGRRAREPLRWHRLSASGQNHTLGPDPGTAASAPSQRAAI